MDVRKLGTSMTAIGAVALVAGMVSDAIRHADDEALATREGILSLDSLAHAVFFGGAILLVFGLAVLLLGEHLYRPVAGPVPPGRRLLQVGAPVLAVALVAAFAAAAGSTRLGEGTPAGAEVDATTDGHDHGAADPDAVGADPVGTDTGEHAHGDVVPGSATGDSPCELSGPPASPGQTGDGHGEVRGMIVQEPLGEAERRELAEQMAAARTVVERYPTVAEAEAAGYHKSTPYVPCIGAHYTNTSLIPGFDPAAPSELLYDGTTPDAKIVGLSYLVLEPGGAPEGFAGSNDHWHQHNANGGLCLQGALVVAGEDSTPEECAALGGQKTILEDIWMAHAWVVPGFECSWGVFAGECPELGGTIGGTAWD